MTPCSSLHTIANTMDQLITDPSDGKQLARPVHAARLVGVSPRTIYNWIEAGRVRTRYLVGGAVVVEVASLFTQDRPENARLGTQKTTDGDCVPAA